MDVYEKLRELGISLSTVTPAGLYATALEYGDKMICTSGHNCKVGSVLPHAGRVGEEVSLEEAVQDARQCAINLLSSLHNKLGDLNKIRRLVKVTGYVASGLDFFDQPKVLDGASQLFAEVFGPERGVAVRTAVGVSALANNQPVVVELTAELW